MPGVVLVEPRGRALRLATGGREGRNSGLEAELGRLFQTLRGQGHRAHFAGQPDFAEQHGIGGHGLLGDRGYQRSSNRQIGGGFAQPEAPGDVEKHVLAGEADAAAALQHGQYHGQPPAVPADDGASRRAQRRRINQRLDLDQHRPRAFDPGEHSRAAGRSAAVGVTALAQKQTAGVGHGGQSVAGHLVNADFVGWAEAVLDRAQNPERMAALALEVQDGVDHVLDHLGAGDRAFLSDVADEDNRRPPALGQPD